MHLDYASGLSETYLQNSDKLSEMFIWLPRPEYLEPMGQLSLG